MLRKKIVMYFFLIALCGAMAIAQPGARKFTGKNFTIGMIGKSTSNKVFMAAYSGARVAAKEIGIKYGIQITIDWRTPQTENPTEQAQAVAHLTQEGVQGIAVACSDAAMLTPAINKAVDAGIQVVCFDADAPKSRRFAYCGSDNAEMGRMMVDELAQVMNEKGTIAVLAGNKNAQNLQVRVRAVNEELKKYPNVKLLANGIFYHDELPDKAAEVVSHAQKANPQIGGWVFIGGWPLYKKNGITWEPGHAKIVAADALPEELDYLKSGHVQVLIAQDCFMWGYKSVELLVNKVVMNQAPQESFVPAPLTRVAKENSEEWSLNWKKWLLKEAVNR
jgi:ribose transport system substrate-binding protein